MWKIFKYKVINEFRGAFFWVYTIFLFFFSLGFAYFTQDPSKTISSILSFSVLLMPLILMVFTIFDYYNSRDFIGMVLSYPIGRGQVFWGEFLSKVFSLTTGWTVGYFVPLVLTGWLNGAVIWMYISGLLLIFSLVPIALLFGILAEDKVSGISLVLGFWLLTSLVYDALILFLSIYFSQYPIEKLVIPLVFLNPIDLARILVVRSLDIAVLMGYTGALFDEVFKGQLGVILIIASLLLWVFLPAFLGYRFFKLKDF
jgi:Cu-processing system permease protein